MAEISEKQRSGEELTDEDREVISTFNREYSSTLEEYYLGNEQTIHKLVMEDASLAEKIVDRIGEIKKSLTGRGDAKSRAERKRLNQALDLYLKAVEATGELEGLRGKILAMREDDEEEIRTADSSNTSQNNKNQPLTNKNGQNMNVRERADSAEKTQYSVKDYPIDSDVEKTVNKAFADRNSFMHELSDITLEQNKAINGLVNRTNDDSYRGKYTGGKHRISSNAIKHIISEHGDFLREGLRAQLPMTLEDISRHLSAVKDNKRPSTINASKTRQGNSSIITSYEVNGYTLFAEEITKSLGKNSPSDLIGHTMYKAPTLSTAHFNATSAQTQPRGQSTVLCYYYTPNSCNLSSGNFIQEQNGEPAHLTYLSVNGVAKQDSRSGGLIPLSSNASNFTDKVGNVEEGYVRCNKIFYITPNNRVFSNSETDVAEKINDLKKQGYDCFVFEKKPGDNYLVAVVNKAQIIKNKPTRYSRKASSDTVTMSKGELQKKRANFKSDKVFSKSDVKKKLGAAQGVKALPSSVREEMIYKNIVQNVNLRTLRTIFLSFYSTSFVNTLAEYTGIG